MSYFDQSTSKGKVVQILCAISFLSLIFYVAFRFKKTSSSENPPGLEGRVEVSPPPPTVSKDLPVAAPQPFSENPPNLKGRVEVSPPAPTVSKDLPVAAPQLVSQNQVGFEDRCKIRESSSQELREPSHQPQAQDFLKRLPSTQEKNVDFRIRTATFNFWLLAQRQAFGTWIKMATGKELEKKSCRATLRNLYQDLKSQLFIMVPIFQAYPEVKTEVWYLFLKHCRSFSDGTTYLPVSCKKASRCLKKLSSWNERLSSCILQREAARPFVWELYDFEHFYHMQMKTRSLLIRRPQPVIDLHALRVCLLEFKRQVEKIIPAFKAHPEIQTEEWSHFLSEIENLQANPQNGTQKFKTLLSEVKRCHAKLFNRDGIDELAKDVTRLKTFLNDFNPWLSRKIDSCDYLISTSTRDTKLYHSISFKAFMGLVEDFRVQLEKIRFFLKNSLRINIPPGAGHQLDLTMLYIGPGMDLQQSCIAFKGCLKDLQNWCANLESRIAL